MVPIYGPTIYLESTVNFVTIRVPAPGLLEVGERRFPLEKSGETTFPRVTPQFKHWLVRHHN